MGLKCIIAFVMLFIIYILYIITIIDFYRDFFKNKIDMMVISLALPIIPLMLFTWLMCTK